MNNQKKKVLIIITKSNFGGAQKYVLELSKNLKNKGFEICVALGGSGLLIEKLERENIEVKRIKSLGRDISIFSDLKTFFALIKIIGSYRPNIVHLNSSKIGGIGALASRILFVPKTIFTIHGWAFNEERSSLSKKIIKLIYSITLILSNKSIAVSKQIKEQAKELPFYLLFKNKIEIVYNGISVPEFLTKEEAKKLIEEKIKTPLEGKTLIGQIAELHPIKSIETTIEAAKVLIEKNKNLIFVVMGDGEKRNDLNFLIEKNDLKNNFFLLGFVDNAAQYIKGFDIFCLTSKSEALALVLLETAFAKTIAIASKVGGIPELITENETGFLFESGNTDELVNKIERIISLNETEKEKITENFHQKVLNNFSIEKMTDETIKVYEK